MEVALVQLIAYTTLTAASVIVGSVSLFVAYRQNFGWPLFVLVSSHGLSGGKVKNYNGASLDIEVWNRRKYPILLRWIEVEFQVLAFDFDVKDWVYDPDWHISRNDLLIWANEKVIDPMAMFKLKPEAPFKIRSLDTLADRVEVRVGYYDPRMRKDVELAITYNYHFGVMDDPKEI